MTIGIAAVGPGAGRAIIRGLEVAETIGEGALGGFVSFVSVDPHAEVRQHGVQQQGALAIRHRVETDSACLRANRAALMSSGPDRPEPLSQFTLASPEGCLVTGHRFPNASRNGHPPLNDQLLARLNKGESARAAVQSILSENPMADAGLVAVDREGGVYSGNCARVAERRDLGASTLVEGELSVTVIHNAIWPVKGIADIIVQSVMREMQRPIECRTVSVSAGTPVTLGLEDAVVLSPDGASVASIQTRDSALISAPSDGAAIYSDAMVYHANRAVGRVITEPYTQVAGGLVRSLDGQPILAIRYQLV